MPPWNAFSPATAHVIVQPSTRTVPPPRFSAVRIFPGNYPADTTVTAGIIVGWNRKRGMVANSRAALQQLMLEMTAALDRGEQLWLTVE